MEKVLLENGCGHGEALLAWVWPVERVGLAEVPPVVHGSHARRLRLVVVGMHHDGLVLGEARLRSNASEDGLRVGEAPMVERALGDAARQVRVACGARHLLAERRLIPRVLGLHPVLEDVHHPEGCMRRASVPEARVPRGDAHRRSEAAGSAHGRVIELLRPAVRRAVVPTVRSALDVRVLMQRKEGILYVHDVDVAHEHRAPDRQELLDVPKLLGRDFVRASRRGRALPKGDAFALKPLRQLIVDCDDHDVGDLGAPVGLDPLLELIDDPRVAHGHEELALDGRLLHDSTKVLSVAHVAILRPFGCRRRHDVVEWPRRSRHLGRHASELSARRRIRVPKGCRGAFHGRQRGQTAGSCSARRLVGLLLVHGGLGLHWNSGARLALLFLLHCLIFILCFFCSQRML